MLKFFKILLRNLVFFSKGKEIGFFDKIKLKLSRRYEKGKVSFNGKEVVYTDAASFVSMYEEIFVKEIYHFKSAEVSPFIIDCGSNIGLSVIYFKSLFPSSSIIAFEPDKNIFQILKKNVESLSLHNIQLQENAIWKSDEELSFVSQGGLSGSIADSGQTKTVKVKGLRLKNLLDKKVDFLKIDIEGAEYEVLKDCAAELKNVRNLFVEYHSVKDEVQRLDEILAVFKEAGFRYQVQEVLTSPNPYIEIKTLLNMDLQLNIFGYRN
jgi:FkbM family methyltransferase